MMDDETVSAALEIVQRTAAVHIDRRASRLLKKVNSVGTVVGEVESADVLASLLSAERIRHDELKAKETKEAWDAVKARRKCGIPDSCHLCGTELSMKACSVHLRDRYARRDGRVLFRCRSCAAKNPSEEKLAAVRKAVGHGARARALALSKEERQARALKAAATLKAKTTKEERQAAASVRGKASARKRWGKP